MAKGFKVQERAFDLIAPNGDVFVYPYFGSGTYTEVMGWIDAAGLNRPSFKDIINLVHTAWQKPDEKHSKEILESIKITEMIADTSVLYLPKGVYVQDHPNTNENGWPIMNEEDLIKRLKLEDKSVRFTEYDYQTGEQTAKKLAENSFVIALAGGKKEADLVAEIASKYEDNPYLFTFKDVDKPHIKTTGLKVHRLLGHHSFHPTGINIVGKGLDRGYFSYGLMKKLIKQL